MRVLYVEDDPPVRNLIRDLLETEGWTVDVCADGDTAHNKIESTQPYDVILTDHGLPGRGGIELARRARELPHRRNTPIFMLTASSVEGDARAAGINQIFKKPGDVVRITTAIKDYLRRN